MTFDFNAMRNMNPDGMVEHLESMRAKAEQQLAEFEALKEQVDAITVTCTDPEERVTVTIGNDGYLTDLVIAPWIARLQYRALGPVIIATLEEAREQLQQRLSEVAP